MGGARAPILPGRPAPLGATWDGKGINFALFSAHAEKVELCLFDSSGTHEVQRLVLPEVTDQVWHGYLRDAVPGLLYGYRVYGPYDPARGHRFNHNKLLLDPYARAIEGTIQWSDVHYGFRVASSRRDLSFDQHDSAPVMPKCRVVDQSSHWVDDHRPTIPWTETVIYETHLRGFTINHPAVPHHLRGTFGGLDTAEVIDYLRALGITSIELLPIHAFVDDNFLTRRGLRNYWGYSTLGFFAPEARYLATGRLDEVKTAIKRLHDAGIEVILDVVYNHTCEGGETGPTLCYRGIDNQSYYRLRPDNPRYYIDDTGCGNTLNLIHPRVLQMVMDSLRYWATELHVDGFRFDLASTLGREREGFDPNGGLFDAIRQDPVLATVKLIAEPWDVGPGGYRLGQYPPGWTEWNDRFRDTVRRYWRGDHGMLPDLAKGLTGSADLFEHNGRRPWCSVNFVACHDGFTLADTVSYHHKHNLLNGEDNRDGSNSNCSDNNGAEGPTDDSRIVAVRQRQQRNMLATVLFSQGTPMILAGDELGRSQNGNNNAYCQDNELSWINWAHIGESGAGLRRFVQRLISLRRRHPVLRWPRYLHGRQESPRGVRDITWVTPTGQPMSEADWHDYFARSIGLLLAGDADSYLSADGTPVSDTVLLLILNAHTDQVPFTLPVVGDDRHWSCLIDTADPDRPEGALTVQAGQVVPIQGRSLALFALGPAA